MIGQHGYPGITLVFQTQYMRNNSRFIKPGTVIQADTTFGNHSFYVTCIAIQDKSLLTRRNTNPWVLLAVAFHEKRESRVHEMIVQDVVNATPALKCGKHTVTVITDNEVGLWKAWKPYGKLLRCCNHFRRNFEDYLRRELHISKEDCNTFIQEVFCEGGLVDAEHKEDYIRKLNELKADFDEWETVTCNKSAGHSSKAFDWLRKRAKAVSK